MNQFIWPQGSKNSTFFTGMLLLSSVYLDAMTSDNLTAVTTTLKLEAMRLVREKIGQSDPDAIMGCMSAIACLATCALVREIRARILPCRRDGGCDSFVRNQVLINRYDVLGTEWDRGRRRVPDTPKCVRGSHPRSDPAEIVRSVQVLQGRP